MLVDTECMRIAGGSWSDPRGMAHITFLISTMSLYGRRSDGRCSVLLDGTIFFLNIILRLNRRRFVYNFSSSDAAELLRVCLVFSCGYIAACLTGLWNPHAGIML